jgi:hypothetical protein
MDGVRGAGGGSRRGGRDAVRRLESFGISLDVPEGWEARAFRFDGGEPTIHLASFLLPPSDGDFGTRATGAMPHNGLFLVVTEYAVTPAELKRGIFAQRPPKRLDAEMLSERTLLRPLAGQRGMQRFFSTMGRAFCLYVVAGRNGGLHLPAANRVLASLAVGYRE